MSDHDDEYEEGCGYSYDHTLVENTEDGLTVAVCQECGAELMWDAEGGES